MAILLFFYYLNSKRRNKMIISDKIVGVLAISSIILTVINIIYMIHTKIVYIDFMKKLGKGKDLDEMLKQYIENVREIKKDNDEI